MKKFGLLFITCGLMLLSSCVPETKSLGRRTAGPESQGASTEDETDSLPPEFEGQARWFSGGQSISGNLLINENTSDVIYLRGSLINNFLRTNNNSERNFCLVISYNNANSSSKKNLRAQASPITFTNFSSGTTERLLKVNIAEENDNQAICAGQAYAFELGEDEVVSSTNIVGTQDAAFSPPKVCPDCSSIINSTRVDLYERQSSGISTNTFIDKSVIDISSLGLRIDVQSNVTDPVGSCSNSGCQDRGFDCCLDGQCANDGLEKPNASSDPDYQTAMNAVIENPQNFTDYPNIFYVCPNITRPDPDQNDPPVSDPNDEIDQQLLEQIEDYQCLEEAKKETPDFSSLGIERCEDVNEYIEIRNAVWERCGCEATPFPTDPDEPACPDFGLKLKLNDNNEIAQVQCLIPDNSIDPAPFQELELSLSNRTAPHRFFTQDGTNFDDVSKINDASIEAEGDEFFYLDESGKTQPVDAAFSMNAILGQFNLELNRARPAKVIPVEFDRVYTIAARSGFYSPCPSCSKDSWFETFSAYPSSQRGTGLQARGHTTARDAYRNNTSNGNYEDTIFGRACWVPPTMIPFTHRPSSDLQTQRQTRLQTQAALFANGYQRDWFGFNKGALIGSFDGVKWFAIGKGRRVVATSQKLFLAINAPFADLSENTDTIVEVVADQSQDDVAEFDYDFDLRPDDTRQNSGASCQQYHSCEVDSDCISKLGWEYACADVSRIRTSWPKFDINANELSGEEIAQARVKDFIQNFDQINGQKRCVYRGAGSVCKNNFDTNLDPSLKKHFTCAPNFYCADLGDAAFNDRVVRTPALLEQILFGQGADVLGRPLQYVGANQALETGIQQNIQHNAQAVSANPSDFGICRPGKSLNNTDFVDRHRSRDNLNRTDYISQIGSCDSSLMNDQRVLGCPVIETRANQDTPVGDIIRDDNPARLLEEQNMCGGESKSLSSTGFLQSSFREIEGVRLNQLFDILTPKVAQDACLRRAGSICHTDLDCGPNRLHAEQASFFGPEEFGGTTAEQRYWEEDLVCSQPTPTPNFNDPDFYDFDLTKNRCVRDIGEELTMFSSVSSQDLDPGIGTENLNLQVDSYAVDGPAQSRRYSRYTSIDLSTPATDRNTLGHNPPVVPISSANFEGHFFQWRTINQTGQLSCNGSGFIRKFADGSKDWGNINRLSINPEEFKCLNYTNPLVLNRQLMIDSGGNVRNYDRDYQYLCQGGSPGGCVQTPIVASDAYEITPPQNKNDSNVQIDTTPELELINQCTRPFGQESSDNVPYVPIAKNSYARVQCGRSFLQNDGFSFFTVMYLPLYIVGENALVDNFEIDYYDSEGNSVGSFGPLTKCTATEKSDIETLNIPSRLTRFSDPTDLPNTWCVFEEDGYDMLYVKGDENFSPDWSYAGIKFSFEPAWSSSLTGKSSLIPGNDLYYLTKLARLELLGVPQMIYEPLYCNDDKDKLVDGIFDVSNNDRASFESEARDYANSNPERKLQEIYDSTTETDNANPTGKFVYQDKISQGAIFSGHEFECCQKLGRVVSSANQCCSGFAIPEDGNLTCKLPQRTNLNVYLNRFISSEGLGEDLPLGGFTDEDFVPETGEPKLQRSVYDKIAAFGAKFCAGEEVRFGSTTGVFSGEPFSSVLQGEQENIEMYSFIDSTQDADGDSDNGTVRFLEGFRWSHHLYCL